MKSSKKAKLPEPPDSNPFLDGLFEYLDSPEGQLSVEAIDVVFGILDSVQVDARARKLLWADDQRLSIDASVKRIAAGHPEFGVRLIEDKIADWLEMSYSPAGATRQQLDELDELTEKWIDDHYRGRRRP